MKRFVLALSDKIPAEVESELKSSDVVCTLDLTDDEKASEVLKQLLAIIEANQETKE